MKRLRTIGEWIVAIPFIVAVAFMEARADRELDRRDREEVERLKARQRARREYRPW